MGKKKFKELETYNINPTEKIHSNIYGINFRNGDYYDNDIPEVIHNPKWIQGWRKRGATPTIITNVSMERTSDRRFSKIGRIRKK